MIHKLVIITVLLSTCGILVAAEAQQTPPHFTNENEYYRVLGELPKRGSLSDILDCAGANELLWTIALRINPRDAEGHEAKRKAGWYSAVALRVFAVDSEAVIKAVKEAIDRKPRSAVLDLARRCRKAPDNWRE